MCDTCEEVVCAPIKAIYDHDAIQEMIYFNAEGQQLGNADPLPSLSQAIAGPRRIAIQNLAHEIGNLTADKNEAYGNSAASVGAILKILYPLGIPPEAYGNAMLIVRILDKVSRIANGAPGFRDIGGYGVLGALINDEPKQAEDV